MKCHSPLTEICYRPFADLSHLGLRLVDKAELVELPTTFTELYQKVTNTGTVTSEKHAVRILKPSFVCLMCCARQNIPMASICHQSRIQRCVCCVALSFTPVTTKAKDVQVR